MVFVKVSDSGPSIINRETARRKAIEQCDECIKGLQVCQKIRRRRRFHQIQLQIQLQAEKEV